MKILRPLAMLALCTGLLLGATSCGVMIHGSNLNRMGWNKSSTNTYPTYSMNVVKSKEKSR